MKRHINVYVEGEVLEESKRQGLSNVSAFINGALKDFIERSRGDLLKCTKCEVAMGRVGWRAHKWKCPACGADNFNKERIMSKVRIGE